MQPVSLLVFKPQSALVLAVPVVDIPDIGRLSEWDTLRAGWALHMGISSNLRQQLINGAEMVSHACPPGELDTPAQICQSSLMPNARSAILCVWEKCMNSRPLIELLDPGTATADGRWCLQAFLFIAEDGQQYHWRTDICSAGESYERSTQRRDQHRCAHQCVMMIRHFLVL